MRTTVDLPEDLHALAVGIAQDTHQTLSQTIVYLIRRGLSQVQNAGSSTSTLTGLPVVHLGRTITDEEIRVLDDEP